MNMINHYKNNGKAFSLIELLVALSILAVVAAIIVPRFLNVRGQAAQATVLQNCRELQQMTRNFVALGGSIGAASQGAAASGDVLLYLSRTLGTRAMTAAGAAQAPVALGGVIDSTGLMGSATITLAPAPIALAVPAAAQNAAAGFYVAQSAVGQAAWVADGAGNAWTLSFDANGNLTANVIAAASQAGTANLVL